MVPMKFIAGVLIVLALAVGVVPLFTDCESQGKAIELANGKLIPMKCHWTGRAELALAAPTLFLGGVLAFGRRRETERALAVLGLVLGAAVIAVPSLLIGVCANPDMLCNMVMRPALIFAGILIVAASAAALVRLRGEGPEIGGLE
jgi:hypothetical protein